MKLFQPDGRQAGEREDEVGSCIQILNLKSDTKKCNKGVRDDICHKHHKQRLCKIITTRVKFYFVESTMWMCFITTSEVI